MIKFSVEEYQNLVSLLKQALLFYADKKNYVEKNSINNEWSTKINIDFGSQAQFALNKIDELEQMYLDTIKDYKNISELEMLNDFSNENESDESWQEILMRIKNIKNE